MAVQDTSILIPVVRPTVDVRALGDQVDETERRLLGVIDGLTSIAKLAREVNLPRQTAARAAIALQERGFLDLITPASGLGDDDDLPPLRYLDNLRTFPLSGAAFRFDYVRLILKIRLERRTGILRLTRPKTASAPDERFKNLYFLNGRLIDARSHPFRAEECLGRMLQRANRIEQGDVIRSLKEVKSRGVRQGEALVELGAMSPEILHRALETQIQIKLNEVFTWDAAEYEFAPRPGFSDKIARIDVRLGYVLFNIVWRTYPFEELRNILERLRQMIAGRTTNPPFPVAEFNFERHMGRFWYETLARDLRVKRILIVSSLDKDNTYRSLFGLYQLGMISFYSGEYDDPSQQTTARLREELLALRQRSHFDALGVHWTAGTRRSVRPTNTGWTT